MDQPNDNADHSGAKIRLANANDVALDCPSESVLTSMVEITIVTVNGIPQATMRTLNR